MPRTISVLALLPLFLLSASTTFAADEPTYDIAIYGGTSGGVAAGGRERRTGKPALISAPGKRLGGLSSGGLGATDIGNKGAIGGISREFYRRIKKHYSDPAHWKQQKPEEYRPNRGTDATNEDAMWTFE